MSEHYKLVLLPEAQKDIRDIVIYIASNLAAPQAALEFQSKLEERIQSLNYQPKRFNTVDEQPWKDAGIRKTRVKNYYIYYLVDDNDKLVNVIAVIYTGRDQTKQMSERKMDNTK